MNALQIALRVVHIVGAVFWGGAMIFNAAFLFPAMRDAGPDGAKVGAGVMKRHFPEITPLVAILTIVSGLWLFTRASAGAGANYMSTGPAMAYSVGGLAAIVAFILGVTVMRPSMKKAMELSQSAASSPPTERERWLGAAQALRERAGKAGNVVAILLVVAAVAMAVARYA